MTIAFKLNNFFRTYCELKVWLNQIKQQQELEWYLGFYHIYPYEKQNFDVVKLFWQAWIDEQRIKME